MRTAIISLVTLAACYSPTFAPCEVQCGSDSPCPGDLACGDDHLCHANGDTSVCSVGLFVTTDGNGAGAVTSAPVAATTAMVNCDSNSSGAGCDDIEFPIGTALVLTAMHAGGNTFVRWSGDACNASTTPTCSFTIVMMMTVNATFD